MIDFWRSSKFACPCTRHFPVTAEFFNCFVVQSGVSHELSDYAGSSTDEQRILQRRYDEW